jgi:hypothetical protein
MRRQLAFWAPVSVVLGMGFRLTGLTLTMDSGGTAASAVIGSFSLVLMLFADPLVLRLSWWVTFGVLFASFRAVHQSPRTPAT